MTSRRNFISGALGGATLAGSFNQPAGAAATQGGGRIRLAVSSYSYWHFEKVKYPCEKVIENAARIGFDGVEILHRQMESESTGYMNNLKKLAFLHGLDLVMLSIHQDFVDPSAEKRREEVEHTKRCIDLASQMGIPAIRLNSGRWGTSGTFDDLMKKKGQETPIEGYTDEDAFKWCIDSIGECLPHAEKAGVMLALENHWGLTTNPANVLKIWKAVNSPWLGINMDTGNYPEKPYDGMKILAPYADIVQAKTYHGGGVWYTLEIDYKQVAAILKDAGFHGYISLEMEGKEDASTAVPKSYKLLREAFG